MNAVFFSGLFYFFSSPANPEVASSGAEESGIQGVQLDPQILGQLTFVDLPPTLSFMSDDIVTSKSPDAVLENNDVIIDIKKMR